MPIRSLSVAVVLVAALAAPLSAGSPEDRSRPWTLMFYMAVDNSAEAELGWFRNYPDFFAPGAGIEAIMLVDRSEGHSRDAKIFGEDFADTRLYRLGPRGFERLAGGRTFPEIKVDSDYEANTADPETLLKFIRFGKLHYPAEHHALILLSHADGRSMLPDEDPVAETTAYAIRSAMGPEDSVDLVVLDMCSMGGIETAYEWRPGNGGVKRAVDRLAAKLHEHGAKAAISTPKSAPRRKTFRVPSTGSCSNRSACTRWRVSNRGNTVCRSLFPTATPVCRKATGAAIVRSGGRGPATRTTKRSGMASGRSVSTAQRRTTEWSRPGSSCWTRGTTIPASPREGTTVTTGSFV